MTIDISELRRLALDGDLAAMQEIILRLKAAETDAAHQKALAESALRVAEGWEEKCNALRAKITEMEKQEPVGTVHAMPGAGAFTMACFDAQDIPVGAKCVARKVDFGRPIHDAI